MQNILFIMHSKDLLKTIAFVILLCGFSSTDINAQVLKSAPDLIITSLKIDMDSPAVFDKISFTAELKNIGNMPTPDATLTGVVVMIKNSNCIFWNDKVNQPLLPGESRELKITGSNCSDIRHLCEKEGSLELTVIVDDVNRIREQDEDNNKYVKTINISKAKPVSFQKSNNKLPKGNKQVISPDGRLRIVIGLSGEINYSVYYDSKLLVAPSKIALDINQNKILGKNPVLLKESTQKIDTTEYPVVKVKSASVRTFCQQLKLDFKENYSLVFRAYNDGLAYKIVTNLNDSIYVNNETVEINLAGNYSAWFPFEDNFYGGNEKPYPYVLLNTLKNGQFCILPVLFDSRADIKIAFSESNVEDYPGLYLEITGQDSLKGIFPKYPKEIIRLDTYRAPVTKTENYMAKTIGKREFPWRVMSITTNDAQLLTSNLIWSLGQDNRNKDFSWVKPGKVGWDWWSALNLFGVDFVAGVNTTTYKYIIDFASKSNLEYVMLDEGWTATDDLSKLNKEVNLPELIEYGKQKNVGLFLWMTWYALDAQMELSLSQFEKMGVKGIKVDFLNRSDQEMVKFYHKLAAATARHHIMLDFHGSFKPDGLSRKYPNVITQEGVLGLENNKWSKEVTVEHQLTLPFTRMWAGPMDFTPGAMRNAQENEFAVSNINPMSHGTRCHQLAMYVIYESPLQMLADHPSNYYREPECMQFLSQVPTVWDTTIVLDAAVSDYVVIARKSGNTWYIGGMTDGSPREIKLNLSFLPDNSGRNMMLFKDGVNADKCGIDFKMKNLPVNNTTEISIKMVPGGGFAAVIYK